MCQAVSKPSNRRRTLPDRDDSYRVASDNKVRERGGAGRLHEHPMGEGEGLHLQQHRLQEEQRERNR